MDNILLIWMCEQKYYELYVSDFKKAQLTELKIIEIYR